MRYGATLFKKWLTLAAMLGRLNTLILLTVFYFVVITPLALILRLFRRSILCGPDTPSLWLERSGEGDMERQF
jgi:hypothetical protein